MPYADFSGDVFPSRLAGEDAPAWLPGGFALIGTLLAIAAAWLTVAAHPEQILLPQAGPAFEQESREPAANLELNAKPQPATVSGPVATLGGRGNTERKTLPTPAIAPAGNGADLDETRRAPEPAVASPRDRLDCAPVVSVPFELGGVVPALDRARADLDALADFLKRHPQAKLSVEGHADASGEDKHNLFLSYRRAKAVLPTLASMGIGENRVILGALGSNSLVEGAPADSPQNRRVVLQVRGSSCPAGRAGGGKR